MDTISKEEVPRWDMTEIAVKGPVTDRAYETIPIQGAFTFGSRTVIADGFYDGEGTYRVRFMPDAEGIWSWELVPAMEGIEPLRGSFRCVEPRQGVHGPVRVSGGIHFAYDDGSFYRPIGTTCYAWNNQDDEMAAKTLKTLASAPFNKLRMCVFPKHYDFNNNEPPEYPFPAKADRGENEGKPAFVTASRSNRGAPVEQAEAERRWNFSAFNPRFFRRLEGQIQELEKLGIEADLILFHPYDRWGFADMGEANDERYLRYVIARLSAYHNIWWSFANEWDLMPWKSELHWDRMFKITQERDPHGHLRSIHNCRPFYDHGKPWVTHCSVQHNDVALVSTWLEQYGKPVVVDECKYEGNLPHRWGDLTAEEMVNRFWEGFCRGAYIGHGETYLRENDEVWWAKGGTLIGKSPERIAFLRRVHEEGPTEGLRPASLGRTVHAVAGIRDEYFLVYLGGGQPAYKNLELPAGNSYTIDIIDAWNMTVNPAPGTYAGSCRVDLPGTPYIALRIKKQNKP